MPRKGKPKGRGKPGGKKKPFSGTRKKEQLKAKRKRAREKQQAERNRGEEQHVAPALTVAMDREGRVNELTTVFMREADADVTSRKNKSDECLRRVNGLDACRLVRDVCHWHPYLCADADSIRGSCVSTSVAQPHNGTP